LGCNSIVSFPARPPWNVLGDTPKAPSKGLRPSGHPERGKKSWLRDAVAGPQFLVVSRVIDGLASAGGQKERGQVLDLPRSPYWVTVNRGRGRFKSDYPGPRR